jgi:hypothetical protein
MPQQRVEVLPEAPVGQDGDAVEDQHDRVPLRRQIGGQAREQRSVEGAGVGCLRDRRRKRDAVSSEALDEIGPEDGRVVVAVFERDPDDRTRWGPG